MPRPTLARKASALPQFHFSTNATDGSPFDITGQYLLAHAVEPEMCGDGSRAVQHCDSCAVGVLDLHAAGAPSFRALGETTAWNWQQGAMLQWLDGAPEPTVAYNVRKPGGPPLFRSGRRGLHSSRAPRAALGEYGAVLLNVRTGATRPLPMPVCALHSPLPPHPLRAPAEPPRPDFALSLNFNRLALARPEIGYAPAPPHTAIDYNPEIGATDAPGDDGIWRVVLASGDARLLVSLARLAQTRPVESMEGAVHWVSHVCISPSGSRFLFLHCWTRRVGDEARQSSRLYTCDVDGDKLALLEDAPGLAEGQADVHESAAGGAYAYERNARQVCSPSWKDDRTVLAWSAHGGGDPRYHLYSNLSVSDGEYKPTAVGVGVLSENGRASFSPDGCWVAVDTYPDPSTHESAVLLLDIETQQQLDVGQFYANPRTAKTNRCALSPRWSRDGSRVVIDSAHENERQIYILDVDAAIDGSDGSDSEEAPDAREEAKQLREAWPRGVPKADDLNAGVSMLLGIVSRKNAGGESFGDGDDLAKLMQGGALGLL